MNHTKYRVSLLTLGCRVNQYESDSLSEALYKLGIEIVPFGERADLSVVNTCTVTAESDRKSRQMIRRAAQKADHVVVTGCFAQISADVALTLEKQVYVFGNSEKASLADQIFDILNGVFTGDCNSVTPPTSPATVSMKLTTPMRSRSYVKIEDGCNNKCSYCIINQARGPVRSKDPALVIEEITALASRGCSEVILTGIETASYGLDFENKKPYGHSLADLIEEVAKIDGIERIGLGSLEPTVMSEYFVSRVSGIKKLLPHFHLSIQSGCSRTLAKMRRKYNADMALDAIFRMKKAMPETTFSADVIVGFPGETEEDFNATVEFCRKVEFLHLHIFPYSKRKGTEAADMPDQVPDSVKHDRLVFLENDGKDIKKRLLEKYVDDHRNSHVYVLCEKTENGSSFGHTEHYIETEIPSCNAPSGTILPVYLTSTDGERCRGVIK
ncbi:MAG: tRNA (N(6)-L-threonylcarbamoyladenosine(37)-C(2))-methylthiotransferase MtaB [Ruminococcaceae bacterium]|nr:tRNA (N(6)-L-threonylcarbamoyladenosine(37)-C(2))-methylthiotransferase MtaB [Oscillospiraceae bacterium]